MCISFCLSSQDEGKSINGGKDPPHSRKKPNQRHKSDEQPVLSIHRDLDEQMKDVKKDEAKRTKEERSKIADQNLPLDRRRGGKAASVGGKELDKGRIREPPDQEVSNQLSNSAHQVAHVIANNSQDSVKAQRYRSKLVRITPTGNATLVLEYESKCPIENKDAISALSRAQTATCKQEITDIVCATRERSLYPLQLPRYCPHQGLYSSEGAASKVKTLSGFFVLGRCFLVKLGFLISLLFSIFPPVPYWV